MPKKLAFSAERKYELLLRISHEIRDTIEIDEVLDLMLDTVGSVVPYDAAGIFVLSQDLVPSPRRRPQGVIAVACRRGFDPSPPEGDDMINQGLGIIGHVIRTGEVLLAPDVSKNRHYVPGRKRTRSEVAVPIATRKRTFGALNLESDQLDAFDAEDVEVLRFIADAAATVLQRTFLHRQLMDRRWMEDQLRLAQQVQTRLLPRDPPRLPGYSVAGLCIPTFEIGGDCFDYIPLPDGRLGILVADVSGKGIPAALFMASFRTLVRTQVRAGAGPAALARAVNRQLNEETGDLAFVTAFYGVLAPQDGRFTYVNCGHNPPMLVRAGGTIESLTCGGLFLGPLPEAEYAEDSVAIEPGDVLLLYTDGVVENAGAAAEDYGAERLEAAVRDARSLEAGEILESVVASTRRFYGSEFFDDDFTLVAIARG